MFLKIFVSVGILGIFICLDLNGRRFVRVVFVLVGGLFVFSVVFCLFVFRVRRWCWS